jgi:basic membrane protein A
VLDGSWKPTSTWGGYKEGMIKVVPLSAAVPAEVKTLVTKLEDQMHAGSFNPFSGPIVDQDGKTTVAAGEIISDAELNKMNYFVEGVASKLPKK